MVRAAKQRDFESIAEIYRAARAYMLANGNAQQWGDNHPSEELILSDIQKGQLYVVEEGGAIHGVFVFMAEREPTYDHIEAGAWKNDAPYGTIHRVASDGKVRGVFDQCLDFCRAHADNLRIDTHEDNRTMQHLIEKNGFEQCGIIYVADGSPRIAYQYVAAES